MTIETRTYSDGTTATGRAPLPPVSPAQQARVQHDYPACATFRGGKCTCDEADKLCPQCGTEEWDHVTAERGRERDVPFNRCCHCDHEWEAV